MTRIIFSIAKTARRPKIEELESILQTCLTEPEVKVVLFSEWERMLELARDRLQRMRIGFAWHTGSVPQKRRRAEIRVFKSDPQCRVFLSTDSGGVGLNLQNASVVINCDLPWNPAKLEQRIARAWRKNQSAGRNRHQPDRRKDYRAPDAWHAGCQTGFGRRRSGRVGDLKEIKLQKGAQTFLSKLELLIGPTVHLEPATSRTGCCPR